MNSKLSVRKIEKHEIQILDCDGELKDKRYFSFIHRIKNSYGFFTVEIHTC